MQRCLEVDALGKLVPDQWQIAILEDWLGRDEDGYWSASPCGLCVPRQNGKTVGCTLSRMVYGALILDESVVYTAHLQKTSTETFEFVEAFVERPKIKKHVKDIKTALGREEVEFRNGGRIKFLARTRNGGNGQHGDLLIFDEAQELTNKQISSFTPAISASPNSQTIYLGTPPDDNTPPDEAFRRIRTNALNGGPGMAWAEWGVDEIGDVTDRKRWYMVNPAMGARIREEKIVTDELNVMDPEDFAIQRLGYWRPLVVETDDEEPEHVIESKAWDECQTDEPPFDGTLAVGVKFGPASGNAALVVCLKPKDRSPYVELIDAQPVAMGTRWVADWIIKRKDKVASVAIDGPSGTVPLVENLHSGGFSKGAIVLPKTNQFTGAVAMLVNAVADGAIEHYGQPALDDAMCKTERRNVGTGGGIGFKTTDEGDASIAEATALALWQATTTKRKPGRKAMVY